MAAGSSTRGRRCVTRGRSPPRAPISWTSAGSPRGQARRQCRPATGARAWSRCWAAPRRSAVPGVGRYLEAGGRRGRAGARRAHGERRQCPCRRSPARGGVRGARRRAHGHAHAGNAPHHAGRPAVRGPPRRGAGRPRDGGRRRGSRRHAVRGGVHRPRHRLRQDRSVTISPCSSGSTSSGRSADPSWSGPRGRASSGLSSTTCRRATGWKARWRRACWR